MTTPTQLDYDVIIVGAGPAGLATAIELGIRNIRVLVVEQNERGGVSPRAKTTNVRTRTHLRRWGIAYRLAAEAPFGIDYPNNMVFVTRLGPGGHELARFENAFDAAPVRSPLYPEHAQWIPQYALEKVLLAKLRSLGSVAVRFDARLNDATQDGAQVSALIDVAGSPMAVTARYLVGADGSRSRVRDLIGARMEGRHGLARSYNVIFRAPGLSKAHGFGPAAIYFQIGRDGFSGIGPMDRDDIWFFGPALGPDETLTPEQAADMIRARTGIDLPYEILSADAWYSNELMADRYSHGRMILVGDACHLHPPFGGYGMNMGIADGVDLGWKIAATLQGWGGPQLVASYEAERRPIHRKVLDEAVANLAMAASALPASIEDDTPQGVEQRRHLGALVQKTKGREFHTLGTVLGLGYEGSPIVCCEDGPPPLHDTEVYVPTARPGYLLPHAWLEDGESLYDCLGAEFTLIAAPDASPEDIARAQRDAATHGVPLAVQQPQSIDFMDLIGASLALVRPDQHVAWRGDRWTDVFPVVAGWQASRAAGMKQTLRESSTSPADEIGSAANG
ncbi:FAD-dependent oxidoreductase [Sphingopyxis sp. Q841]|uniref:FAD-dependent oxidoreductase n=1 Tax=Sphingopyxis sp. Q841 TaxID=3458250 RepID=UPI0040360D39